MRDFRPIAAMLLLALMAAFNFALLPLSRLRDSYDGISHGGVAGFWTRLDFALNLIFAGIGTPVFAAIGIISAIVPTLGVMCYLLITNAIEYVNSLRNENSIEISDESFFDGIIPEDISILLSTHSLVASTLRKKSPVDKLTSYSESTKDYVKKFDGKKPYSEIISEVELSDQDRKRFKKFHCKYSKKLADIPVYLNGNLYDLATLINALEKDRRDPLRGIEFDAIQIQPARDVKEKLEALIKIQGKNPTQNVEQINGADADNVALRLYPKYTFSDPDSNKLRKKINSCSENMNLYLEKFKNQKNYLDIIEDMNLSINEKNKFEKLCCTISRDVPNIPVKLNGNIYDFNWLLEVHKRYGIDPVNKYLFDLIEIQPAPEIKEQIEAKISEIEIKRLNGEKFESAQFPGYTFSA